MRENPFSFLSDLEPKTTTPVLPEKSASTQRIYEKLSETYGHFFKSSENKIKIDPTVAMLLARMGK